ncbi:voltage-dependent T-type calcium channel subunit alpha-1G-like isoform X2 [Actinia tenebrosa]|uniref:Voltage-dependent T-type calcium channel subunit alpha-1G-like isoform X2 n=1 Tax=Actinia tenebrosa TaxID=6105 RepID=A0A6P8H4W0_ACTTE|nr:voltage-dependent T-type calcium channel subunit alpha-1G-like isoform X2 [Actinia tenebrosa]
MEIEQNDVSISLENSTRELTPPKVKESEPEAEVIDVENRSCFILTQKSFPRKCFIRIFKNPWFERVSLFVIFVNCVTLAMYDPYDRHCQQLRCTVLEILEHFIFAFFFLEMVIKMIAMGVLGKKGYMQDSWNRLDFVIIIVGIVEKLMKGSDYLTIIRAFRVLRPLRAINKVPNIRILVTLLLDTLPMLGNVLLLTFFIFFVFGIIGVQLWQGKLRNRCFADLPENSTILLDFNKSLFYKPSFEKPDFLCSLPKDYGMTKCPSDVPSSYQSKMLCTQSPYDQLNRAQNSSQCVDWNRIYSVCKADGPNPFHGAASFDNIAIAWIAIFQVITLEGWSELMYLVQDSHSLWNWIYFIILVVIGSFFLVNLCLVVITMQFQETKAREIELIEESRKRQGVNISSMQTYSCLQTVKNYIRSKRAVKKEDVHHHHHHFYHHHHFHHHLYDCYSPASPLFLTPTETKPAFFAGQQEEPARVPSITIESVDNENSNEGTTGVSTKPFLLPPEQFIPRRESEASLFAGAISIHTEASSSVHDKEILTTSSVTLTVPGSHSAGTFAAAHATACATSSLPIIKVTEDDTLASAHASASATAALSADRFQSRPRSSSESCSKPKKRHDFDLIPSPSSARRYQRRHSQPFGEQEIELSKRSPMNSRKWLDLQEIEMKKLEIQTNQLQKESSFVRKISIKRGKDEKHNSKSDDSIALLGDGGIATKQVMSSDAHQPKPLECHDNNNVEDVDEMKSIDNKVYKKSTASEDLHAGLPQKDDDMYDSMFDLHQCDSYDVEQNNGLCYRFRNFCRKIAESRHFIHFIMTSILLNMVCMGMEHHNQPEGLTKALDKFNILFVTIFSVEMAINLLAYGITEYLNQLLNVFDGFVVIVSITELLVESGQTKLSVFRSIRLLRIFKLVRPVRYQLLIVIRTMNSVITFFGLLFLFMFAFSILGMNLFGGKFVFRNAENEPMVTRSNFDSFLWAMVTVFQILTQENWNLVMYDGMRAINNWAALYFIALMLIGYYVLFNLLVAILVEGFTSTGNRNGSLHEEIRIQSVAPTPSSSVSRDENADKKLRCDLTPPKPSILINGVAEWDENGCTSKPASSDQHYCYHAVRNAFRSNPVIAPSEKSVKRKSLKKRLQERISRVSTSATSFSDVEGLDGFLTMPELKKKRQTSVALLRKTRTKHRPSNANLCIFNPAFAIDDEVKNDMAEKVVKGNNKTFYFHRKLSRKTSNDVPRDKKTLKEGCDLNGKSPNDVRKTGQTTLAEAPLADIRTEMPPDIDLSSGEYERRDMLGESVTPTQGDVSYSNLEIRAEPSLTQEDETCNITEISHQERKVYLEESVSTTKGRFGTRSSFSLYLFSPQNRFRVAMVTVCDHKIFDYVILVFILLSCGVLAMEGPDVDQDPRKRQIIDISMFVFTIIFTIEMIMKIIAMGFVLGPDTYLKLGWNVLDFVLVLMSWLDVIITHVPDASVDILGSLKVFRALRTLRPLRMIHRAPGLKLVVQTLLYSLQPIGNTVLIAGVFYVMFGILGVQLFKGQFYYCEGDRYVINRAQCLNSTRGHWVNRRYNFDNLLQALISLFIVSTRDGWIQVMHHGIDAVGVDMQPVVNYAEWCLIYFIPFLLLGGFLVLNMIVGVVVENFQRCRAKLDEEERKYQNMEKDRKAKKKAHVDDDQYYAEFNVVRRRIHNLCIHQYWDITIAIIICLNVICMSLEHYNMSKDFYVFVETTNYFFTAVFALEVVLKGIALGPVRYVKDRWNIVDLIIVILSVLGILLTDLVNKDLPINPTVIRTLRVLRIVRVLKLVKLAKGVRSLLDTLFEALPQVANLGLLFLLLFFIYSCLGIQLFGSLECSHDYPCEGLGRHANFHDLGSAMLTLFRIATGDNWNGILKDTLRSKCDGSADCRKNCCITKYTAPLYFVTFVLSAQFVLVNVVIAVLMKHLKESKEKLAATLAAKDLEKKLKVLTLVARNFIRAKASRKPSTPITRRRSVVELGLGGIELAQLKKHNKDGIDESFYQEVIKADAIFQQFIKLNASLRKAKMKACRTSSSTLGRVFSLNSKVKPKIQRRHSIARMTDLADQDTSSNMKRIVWKSGCEPL